MGNTPKRHTTNHRRHNNLERLRSCWNWVYLFRKEWARRVHHPKRQMGGRHSVLFRTPRKFCPVWSFSRPDRRSYICRMRQFIFGNFLHALPWFTILPITYKWDTLKMTRQQVSQRPLLGRVRSLVLPKLGSLLFLWLWVWLVLFRACLRFVTILAK